MKRYFKTLLFAALVAAPLASCDDDTDLPVYKEPFFYEKFEEGEDNTPLTELVAPGWKTYVQAGSAIWTIQRYSDNGYAEFNPYGSGNASNIGWLVSPAIELSQNNNNILEFQSSQAFTSNAENKLEVFVSTNYDGTNVAAAEWTPVTFRAPRIGGTNFAFTRSGEIKLSQFSGTAHIAFKVTGSGTNTALDGSYQIDNVVVY